MATVRVGQIELDCERSGSGPPLLLIMGMSGTSLHWGEPLLVSLRRDFDVIAYDHRGVGASSPDASSASWAIVSDPSRRGLAPPPRWS